MLEQVNTAATMGFTVVDRLLGAVQNYKALKYSKKSALRAYFFELSANLRLLNQVDEGALKNAEANAPGFVALVNNLEILMAASILFTDDATSKKLFLLLEEAGPVDEENEEGAEAKRPIQKTVLQAMLFTVNRITLLQKLAAFPSEPALLKPLRLGVRIKNITAHLVLLKTRELNKKENFLVRKKPGKTKE
jgi:hypothetical protein